MNVLHLYSDFRWTGPAEPVLSLCQELTARGHNLIFAYRKPPETARRPIAKFVGNFKVTATDRFRLNRYFSFSDNLHDFRALRRFIREQHIEVVHAHLDHDHTLAALALLQGGFKTNSSSASQGRPQARPVLVRTDHKRDSFTRSFTTRLLVRQTQGLMTFSERARRYLIDGFGLAPDKVRKVNPAIDTDRFAPEKGTRALRHTWGLDDKDIAIGMVARFQQYRKCDLLLRAFKRALPRVASLKAVLIGRSSQMEETVHKPIRELGLQDHVVVAGYLTDGYIDGLASLDGFVFPIAGSDGTGRALREAMAMGKAVIVNNIGMLPEMIEEGRSGLLFNDNEEDLAKQLVRLGQDASLRERLGRAARERAQQCFSPTEQAEAVEAFYRELTTQQESVGAGAVG
jgi:glycosyltransferase involved in cell wall biosynthesis